MTIHLGVLLSDLATAKVTPTDVIEACLGRIAVHRALNAFVRVDAEGARAEAARWSAAPLPFPPWRGVPIAVKDNLAVKGQPLHAGSRVLDGFVAPEDAEVVARLRRAGAIIVGHTNMDEFGMGASTELGRAGPTENPVAPGRVVGGSSGGSAAAVAAGLVPAALGSDTGGSIRQPAAFCGVVGLKPTWGRVSRRGLVAFASSLDTVGPIAGTVKDAAHALAVIAGPDPGDATSAAHPFTDLTSLSAAQVGGMTVGITASPVPVHFDVEAGAERARRALERAGARTVEIALPHAEYALSTYVIVATAEASSNLSRYDGVRYGLRADSPTDLDDLYVRTRTLGFGPEVQRRLLAGTYVLSTLDGTPLFERAARVRTLIIDDYRAAFARCDVLLGPTTPEPPFARGHRTDPLAMYHSDVLTVGPSLAGLPAISIPAGRTQDGLPVGVQLVAPWWAESRLVAAAMAIERELSPSAPLNQSTRPPS